MAKRLVRKGACKQRGHCCHSIHLVLKNKWIKWVWYWLLLIKISPMRHFSYDGLDDDGDMIFSCKYLTNCGKCSIYKKRPFLCRIYPTKHTYHSGKMLPGCGYYFEWEDA